MAVGECAGSLLLWVCVMEVIYLRSTCQRTCRSYYTGIDMRHEALGVDQHTPRPMRHSLAESK